MPPLPESSWLDAFCPLAPASAVGFPFLGGATSVHVCVPHDGSRGGLIVVPKFLSTDETLVMTAAIEDKVNSNSTATYRRSWLNLPVGNNDRAAIKMAELPKLGSRLISFPGKCYAARNLGSSRRPIVAEQVQVAVTRHRVDVNVHHDRNLGQHRVLTVLGYVGTRQATGGHTIFPLFDVPSGSGGSGHPTSGRVRAALDEIRAAIRRVPRRENSNDGRAFMGLKGVQTLCEATHHAALAGRAPPCLAVPPTPGSAAIFYQRATGEDGQLWGRPEWSNFHIACPVYGDVPKLAYQSFRENISLAPDLVRSNIPRLLPHGAQRAPRKGGSSGGIGSSSGGGSRHPNDKTTTGGGGARLVEPSVVIKRSVTRSRGGTQSTTTGIAKLILQTLLWGGVAVAAVGVCVVFACPIAVGIR